MHFTASGAAFDESGGLFVRHFPGVRRTGCYRGDAPRQCALLVRQFLDKYSIFREEKLKTGQGTKDGRHPRRVSLHES